MSQEALIQAAQFGYSNNISLKLQQKTSRLKMCAMLDTSLTGKSAKVVELFGESGYQLDLPRNARAQPRENTAEGVYCRPRRINTEPHILEREDFIKRGTDYNFAYTQADAAALNRGEDAIMAAALWADRLVGEDGATSQPYANANGYVANNYVPSGAQATSGLTIPKIVKGLELLEQAEVDLDVEEIFLQVTSVQVTNLYNELGFTNRDYTDKQKLQQVRSKVHELLGVKMVRMPNALVRKVSTTRRCMMFAKSGFVFGQFAGVEAMATPHPDYLNRIMLASEEWVGATRTEDEKFVPVDCEES